MVKSKTVYVLLALFLGLLGIHNFYAGYTTKAIIQLFVTLLTGWLIIPLFVIAFWVLIEIVVTDKDANGSLLG